MLKMQMHALTRVVPFLAGALSAGWLFAGEKKPAADPLGPTITHVDAAGAARLLAEQKVLVLDVRTPREYGAGHIAGAINIDLAAADFEKRLDQLDKTKTYLVHCASGGRSTKSLPQFKKLGFHSVVHLDGGIKAWQKAGQPVEK